MKKTVLMLACGLGLAAYASAQIKFAPVVGANLATATYKISDKKQDMKAVPGFHVGGVVDLPITQNISLMPGIMYSMKGAKNTGDVLGIEYESRNTINYLEVPVDVVFMSGKPGEGRLMAHVGPYVGYALGGKNKFETLGKSNTKDLEFGDDAKKDNLKPLEFGANIGLGYILPMGAFVRFDYHHGLNNLLPGGDSKNLYKNRTFMLTIGYFFGGK